MNYILQTQVNEDIINYFDTMLDSCIDKNIKDAVPTTTYNGFQTSNIIAMIDPNISKNLSLYFQDFLVERKKYFDFDDVLLQHVHLIKYYKGGYQNSHDHYRTEDFSFLLYLNDSDGDTKFYIEDTIVSVKPERGKLIIFDSFLWHSGDISYSGKKIAVGALKLFNKKWIDRSRPFLMIY